MISVLDVGEWSALRPGRFTRSTHWLGGWAGPRACPDAVEKRNISWPCRESKTRLQDYITLNDGMIDEWWIGKDLEGRRSGLNEILSQYFPGRTEEKQGKSRSR
jgi:hypothetical protein